MAISAKYENFSFVGSREDLFTKYKRKCATVKRKKTRFIPMAVVLVCLVGLIIGLSVGLHVTHSSKTDETDDKLSANDEARRDNDEPVVISLNISSIEQMNSDTTVHSVLAENQQKLKEETDGTLAAEKSRRR